MKTPPAQHPIELLHVCHSCFLLRSQSGTTLLLDPYFGSEFKWKGHLEKHVGPAPALRPEEIAECHGIVVTHDHPDHCESRALGGIMSRTRCQLWGPAGIYRRAVEVGIDNMQVNKLEPGNRFKIGDIEVLALPNKGSEDLKPCMRMSYLFRVGETTVFHGGDSHGPSLSWTGQVEGAGLVLLWPVHIEKTVQSIKPQSLALTHCDKFQPGEFLCGGDEDAIRAELTRRFKALVVLAPGRGEWFWPEKLSIEELRRRAGKPNPRPRPAGADGAVQGAPAAPAAPAAAGPAGPTGQTSQASQTESKPAGAVQAQASAPATVPAEPPAAKPAPEPAPAPAPRAEPTGADRWRAAREASAEWWRGENRRRPLLRVTAPLDPADPPAEWDPSSLLHEPNHVGESIRRYAGVSAKTFHAAEAQPFFGINLAPAMLAAMLTGSAEPDPARSMGWADIEKLELKLDASNVWWHRAQRATALVLEIGGGEMVPSLAALGAVLDALAALRGGDQLLADLASSPEQVKAASSQLAGAWRRCVKELAAPVLAWFNGTVDSCGFFSPGRHHMIRCDLAARIPPAAFAEVALPGLEAQAEGLDCVSYLLDGPGQLVHLDALLGMGKLHAVQWLPGAGAPPAWDAEWRPLLKKIQASGRAVGMALPGAEGLEAVLAELDPRLIMGSRHCASRGEAEDFVALAEKLSARG